MTAAVVDVRPTERTPFQRYMHSLWLLTKRDLQVRYTTNALGYLWSILDPLLMAGVYYVVFAVIFHRGNSPDESPYMVFLLSAMLPWTWFNGTISDATRAFAKSAKLIRSTSIPRTIWINRSVTSKGIEFLLSLPVLILFILVFRAPVHWEIVFYPLAIVIQFILCLGCSLIVAPIVVFFTDLSRAVPVVLRLLFYGSGIMYSPNAMPHALREIVRFNPLTGIFGLYRAGFFPVYLDWWDVLASAVGSLILLGLGMLVFSRSIRNVLKEM